MTVAAVAIGAMLAGATVAGAADQLLTAKKLILKDLSNRNTFKMISKDPGITIAPADEPTVTGLTVRIKNPVTLEEGSVELPASGWTVNRSGTTFKFKDPILGKAMIRNGRQVTLNLRTLLITLNEEQQGSLAVVLAANASRWCFLFDQISVKKDKPCKFIAKKAAAPVECVDMQPGSPSGAFLEAGD